MLWWALLAIMALSLTLRLEFYTGFYGSDEVTYLAAAVKALRGDWSVATYIGALRYGFQLPISGFMYLFGQREMVANLWPLLCSLAEVGIVVLAGNFLFGFRAAILAGLMLGVLPLHVHYAGRIMADAPLALFMTISFVLFWLGQCSGRALPFFIAGLAAGCVFWIKESTTFYLAVFVSYPLIFRCWNWKWLWMVAGFALPVAANLLLFWQIAGNPFHVLHSAASSVSAYKGDSVAFAQAVDTPWYYLEYLFFRIYHTGLLGYLAVGGFLAWWRLTAPPSRGMSALTFVVWWALGMLLLFSLLPVSLAPLKLVLKQVNYMLVFVAPLALLAGYFLATMRAPALATLLVLVLSSGIVLSALERNTVAVFTANSKAAVGFAQAHPEAKIYGAAGAQRAAIFFSLTHPDEPPLRIGSATALLQANGRADPPGNGFAIVDTETLGWGNGGSASADQVPACWTPYGTLTPEIDVSLPGLFEFARTVIAGLVPEPLRSIMLARLNTLITPRPEYVYALPRKSCEPGRR